MWCNCNLEQPTTPVSEDEPEPQGDMYYGTSPISEDETEPRGSGSNTVADDGKASPWN